MKVAEVVEDTETCDSLFRGKTVGWWNGIYWRKPGIAIPLKRKSVHYRHEGCRSDGGY